jgi:hypothetical protein
MVGDQRNTAEFGYQRTISPNKIGKILSQMNHLTKMALGESYAVEIQARAGPPHRSDEIWSFRASKVQG